MSIAVGAAVVVIALAVLAWWLSASAVRLAGDPTSTGVATDDATDAGLPLLAATAENLARPDAGVIEAGVVDDEIVPPEEAAAFLERRNRIFCEREIRCGTGGALWSRGVLLMPPRPACHPTRLVHLRDGAEMSRERMDECADELDGLERDPCSSDGALLGGPFSDCSWLEAAGPAVPLEARIGAPCRPRSYSCGLGATCEATGECEGVCRPAPTLGEECGLYRSCPLDLRCSGFPHGTCVSRETCSTTQDCNEGVVPVVGGYCIAGSCVDAPRAEGEECDWMVARGRACLEGLVCPRGGRSTCERVRGLGEACGPAPCEEPLQCTDGTCRALPSLGEPCRDTCAAGAYCVPREGGDVRVCAADATGMHCWMPRDEHGASMDSCPTGYACVGEVGAASCVPTRVEGETCGDGEFCSEGLACVDGRCRRIAGPGERCGLEATCPQAYSCREGSCVPWAVLGEPCDAGLPCLEGTCIDGACGHLPVGAACPGPDPVRGPFAPCVTECVDGRCAPFAPAGAACGHGTCEPGYECTGLPPGRCTRICAE